MTTYVLYFAATLLSVSGGTMLLLPTKTLLRFDRKTGYRLYANAPNEAIGLRRARWYYCSVGSVLAVGPWLILFWVL
jgi:hypothetical protein